MGRWRGMNWKPISLISSTKNMTCWYVRILWKRVDIPSVNTIIVNNAHQFGLSDLHQLRGRAGRSNKKAFCYLLAPSLATLPPIRASACKPWNSTVIWEAVSRSPCATSTSGVPEICWAGSRVVSWPRSGSKCTRRYSMRPLKN